jgi:hypothetical protein
MCANTYHDSNCPPRQLGSKHTHEHRALTPVETLHSMSAVMQFALFLCEGGDEGGRE